MIDKDKIGCEYNISRPNGGRISILIEDNPDKFPFYKKLGLDVFTDSDKLPTKKVEHNMSELKGLKAADLKAYAKENGIEGNTMKDILNAIREGNK